MNRKGNSVTLQIKATKTVEKVIRLINGKMRSLKSRQFIALLYGLTLTVYKIIPFLC